MSINRYLCNLTYTSIPLRKTLIQNIERIVALWGAYHTHIYMHMYIFSNSNLSENNHTNYSRFLAFSSLLFGLGMVEMIVHARHT